MIRARLGPSVWFVTFAALSALACGGGKECGEGTVNTDKECVAVDAYLDSADTGEAANSPPEIVRASAGGGSITQDETVTVVAEVQDADGTDDVVAGVLRDGAGNDLGAFARAGDGDRWEATVSWWDLHAIEAIDFVESAERTLVLRFTDRAAHLVETELTLALDCGVGGACDGVCTVFAIDEENCGACGNVCPDSPTGPGYCSSSTCWVGGECIEDLRPSCEEHCIAQGWRGCVRIDLLMIGVAYDTDDTCADYPDVQGNARPLEDCDVSIAEQAEAGADLAQCFCES